MSLLLAHTYWKHTSGLLNLAKRTAKEDIHFLVEV
jgi:hypothetical protein